MKFSVFILFASLIPALSAAQDGVRKLSDAVAWVKKETDVQVLSAKEKTVDGHRVFRIKVLDKKGVVRLIDIKAQP